MFCLSFYCPSRQASFFLSVRWDYERAAAAVAAAAMADPGYAGVEALGDVLKDKVLMPSWGVGGGATQVWAQSRRDSACAA